MVWLKFVTAFLLFLSPIGKKGENARKLEKCPSFVKVGFENRE